MYGIGGIQVSLNNVYNIYGMGRTQLSLKDVYLILISACIDNHLDAERRAGCFDLFVFLVSRDCYVALPRGVMGLFICSFDCVISWSFSLTILYGKDPVKFKYRFLHIDDSIYCLGRIQFNLNNVDHLNYNIYGMEII